jgi:hypothetical protein
LDGGDDGVGTTAVGPEVADADPPAFVAVTVTSMVWPSSPFATVYVVPVAPAILVHPDPLELQSLH